MSFVTCPGSALRPVSPDVLPDNRPCRALQSKGPTDVSALVCPQWLDVAVTLAVFDCCPRALAVARPLTGKLPRGCQLTPPRSRQTHTMLSVSPAFVGGHGRRLRLSTGTTV